MTEYIATFHTHFAALCTHRALTEIGVAAALMPVPRKLSASCGTCVRYEAAEPNLSKLDGDVELVVRVAGPDVYETLLENR